MAPGAIQNNGANASNGTALKATARSFHPTGTPDPAKYHAASSSEAISAEAQFAAHNYHPLPIVFARASGCSVWDPEGKHYLDFLSAYSAVNQGHCHPELIKALTEQASRLTLSSRAFYNDVFPRFAEFVTKTFGFDMVLPMNTGAEAVETAVKIARKWGYKVKGIPENKALVFSVTENFHGRTFAAITMSTDPESRENYGPYLPGIGSVCPSTGKAIRYNNVDDVREAFEHHGKETAAFLVEPIQGEAGIVVPDDNYLREVKALCEKHNVLLICDEIQTGIARTGKMLCHEWSGIKPDLVLLGKAISGGMYPVSCVLGSREVMLTIEPGTHGSTYGGNPLGSAVAIRALELIQEENMIERAEKLGQVFRDGLNNINNPMIKTIRGKGLLNAIVIDESRTGGHSAWDLCMLCKKKGLLAKPTHQNIIRLAPPLVITEQEIESALKIIAEAMTELPNLKGKKEEDILPPGEKNVHIGVDN
ncbi:ornithine aminotransferas-like protein [Clohesyomyces aquaticus]|uniref:Ornithine aminotransferase n=1 Tax=Clohesyomyces aquaticus TaxID=1231657 RepID=A0A1Y1ZLW8_9PLEO|nr:ornithine aminotransferas-like protein [Clohesyomyces aquaticus]